KALPFMKEAALFYEDYIQLDEEGFIAFYPSVSPENTPQNYMPADESDSLNHPMPTTINSTMDIAILKELLKSLIEGSKKAGIYTNDINKWSHLLQQIPPYQMNEEGDLREWMHPDFDDNYEHRHLSHLYPIFPGKEITEEWNPELTRA